MTMNSIFKRPKPNRTRTIIKVLKMLSAVYKPEPLPVRIQVKIFILTRNKREKNIKKGRLNVFNNNNN